MNVFCVRVFLGFVMIGALSWPLPSRAQTSSYQIDITAVDHSRGHYLELGTALEIKNNTAQNLTLIFDPSVAVPRVRIAIPEGVVPFSQTIAVGESFHYEPEVLGSYRFGITWQDGTSKAGELAVVEPAGDDVVDILIVGVAYFPSHASALVGQTVRWINTTGMDHTVTADASLAFATSNITLPDGAEPFHSGRVAPGSTFSRSFAVAGEYGYVCLPHERMGHVGSLTVE